MKRIAGSMLASQLLLSACGGGPSTTPATTPANAPADSAAKPATTPAAPSGAAPAESPKPPANVDMDAAIAALMAKPEQPDESISIQHVLIAFKGAPRMTKVTRSKDEAKVMAQQVYAEAIGGADFLALVKKYTDDSAPGIYALTKAGRTGYVKGFGDVGFRLKVGEIGVAPWEAKASPFGWHIIKRVK
jgi:parvulin-like peptidyl-prolyl isomerase